MPRKKKDSAVTEDSKFEDIVEVEDTPKVGAAGENDDLGDIFADEEEQRAEIISEIEAEGSIEELEDEKFAAENEKLVDKRVKAVDKVVKENDKKILNKLNSIADLDDAFRKRRYEAASRRMRRKLYESEPIITYAGEEVESHADKKHSEAQYLLQLAQSIPPVPVKGKIIGIEGRDGHYAAKVNIIDDKHQLGFFDVLIPSSQLFPYSASEFDLSDQGRNFLRDRIWSMVGANILFVVYDVKEEKHTALGSRVKAMELSSGYYYRRATGNKRVYPGVLAQAKVISARKDRVICDVLGADVEIKSDELSWNALENVDSEFAVGDIFPVRIQSVEPYIYKVGENRYNLFNVKASRKAALPNPAEEFYDSFEEGGVYAGIVKTGTVESGFWVNLCGKLDCLCKPGSIKERVVRGCECTVAVTKKKDDKHRLEGVILSITK